ncbi:MAG: discoidin domain-containing protein [Oscillospiraceae bacterium]|jgi:hypothetical protein|nr:discoidin domain-containing protein [Oscillospiraceae bacterium]
MKGHIKKMCAILLTAVMCVPGFPMAANANEDEEPSATRQEVNFNGGWRFWRGGEAGDDTPGMEAYDDSGSKWYRVSLPHSIEYVTYDNIVDYKNIAWYRKTFNLPESAREKRIFVRFGAAMQTAKVFINGAVVNGKTPYDGGLTNNPDGVHSGGFMDFVFDITESKLNYGEGTTNVIAVKIDTSYNVNWAPGAPNRDFRYFGGLYRSAALIVTDPVHVTDPIHANKVASGGLFVRTDPENLSDPNIGISNIAHTDNENGVPTDFVGDVKFWVGTHVQNDSTAAQTVTVDNLVLDASGNVVFSGSAGTRILNAGEDYQFTQTGVIMGARLWHPYSPNLYTVKAVVSVDHMVVDEYSTKTGFRTVVFRDVNETGSSKMTVNGQPFEGLGTNTHQEVGMVGFAVPEDAVRDEIRMIKDAGFDFIRAAHYPYQEAFYEACDEYGVMVQAPLTGWQYYPSVTSSSYETFGLSMRQEALELIRRGRNHPSIVTWELFPNESSLPIASTVVASAKAEFPTYQMLTTGNTDDYDVRYNSSAVKPYVTYEFGDWQYGGYASTTRRLRWDSRESKLRQAVANYQNALDSALNSRADYAFYWVWQDYSGFGVTDPDLPVSPGGNAPASGNAPTACGMVDYYRIPKYAYYYAQSQRDPDVTFTGLDDVHQGPMVYIATRRFDTDMTNNVATDVPVYSNCEQIELQDGEGRVIAERRGPDTLLPPAGGRNGYVPSTAVRATKHPPFTFADIGLAEYPTVTAVGYMGGVERARYTVKTPAAAKSLRLRWQSGDRVRPLVADGGDKRLVYVDLLDTNGEIKTDSGLVDTAMSFGAPTKNATTVTVRVTGGSALLLGGDASVEPGSRGYNSVTVTPRGGQVAVWLVAGRTVNDRVTVQATADGLTASNVLEIGTAAPTKLAGADDLGYLDEPYPNPTDDCLATGGIVSASSGHAARASDGHDETVWTADSAAAGEYWMVDLKNRYNLSKLDILWAEPSAYQYQVLCSDDGIIWKNWIDKTYNTLSEQESVFAYSLSESKVGRYIKIVFTAGSAAPFAVAEVHILGQTAPSVGDVNVIRGTAWWEADAMGASEASNGCDGDPNRYATASNAEEGNRWVLDLGGYRSVASINIMWERSYAYPYQIEVSSDNRTWLTILNKFRNTAALINTVDEWPSPICARYVRLTSGWGEFPMSFSMFDVYGRDARDLVLGKTLTTDSATWNGYAAFYANDDDPATAWRPDADGRSLSVTLESPYDIAGARIVWEEVAAHEFLLLTSVDGVRWQKAAEGCSDGQTALCDVFAPDVRYVKLLNVGHGGVATWELYGDSAAGADVFGQRNALQNPSFAVERTDQDDARESDPEGWEKLTGIDRAASYVEETTDDEGGAHGSDNRCAVFAGASAYSASLYQTVRGLPSGLYTFSAWVKRDAEATGEPRVWTAYVENYGAETIVEDLLASGRVPQQPDDASELWRPVTIRDIHVTNGRLTVGFYAHAEAGQRLLIDDVSLTLTDPDPPWPVYDPNAETTSVSALRIVKEQDVLTAGYAARNVSSNSLSATHIFAAYDENGRLTEVLSETAAVPVGEVVRGSLRLERYNPDHMYQSYLWEPATHRPLCEMAAFKVFGIYDVTVDIEAGGALALPDAVTVWYTDYATATERIPVVWDLYDADMANRVGTFAILGTVAGTQTRARAIVTVRGVNLIQNPDLEAAAGWTFTAPMSRASSSSNSHGPNPGYINYSQPGAGVLTGRAAQSFAGSLPGTYTLSCWVEGVTNAASGVVELYVNINGEEYATAPITVTVWGDWFHPTIQDIPIPVNAVVEIGVRASNNQGSWYHFDDFLFIQTQ